MHNSKKITFAAQDRIDEFDSLATEFFRTILDLDYRTCFVSDESRLCDFSLSGNHDLGTTVTRATANAVYDLWDAWVVPRICEKYGLTPFSTAITLVELFEEIERVSAVQH